MARFYKISYKKPYKIFHKAIYKKTIEKDSKENENLPIDINRSTTVLDLICFQRLNNYKISPITIHHHSPQIVITTDPRFPNHKSF